MSINNPQINSSRSAFLLDTVSSRQSNTDWIDISGNAGTFGWFAGGGVGLLSTVDRIDFSNDSPTTASPRGPLITGGMKNQGATGNSNYGWWGGGPSNSGVYRIDFANDSPTSASIRGPLSATRNQGSATGNANYGWWSGGFSTSLFDRIDFSNDLATASLRGGVGGANLLNAAGTANANYGWIAGGQGFLSLVQRIDFSNDLATTSSRGVLSQARGYLAATSNASYGWFAGGNTTGPTTVSTVDRIDFSNDSPTSASPRGPLSAIKLQFSAAGNANYGWFGGGYSGVPTISTVDRIDFSNDSPIGASIRGPLSAARGYLAAVSNYVKPLIVGRSATSINPSAGTVAVGNANFGWFGGGAPGPGAAASIVDRIDFSNDSPTAASPRGPLSQARSKLASASNANYGWFAGGYLNAPNNYSTVDRIDFANDSPFSASPRSTLNRIRWFLAATSNANYGWFAGGILPSSFAIISDIYRIDFSNDSPSSGSLRGPLNVARSKFAATGNANYGWFGGGPTPITASGVSSVDRVDYANDSPTAASARGPLSAVRYGHAAAGNANYGWFTGQFFSSRIDRVDYANDSPTSASVRGTLSQARENTAATGNANYGWFGSGKSSPTLFLNSIDRIDFSNDSPTAASPRGPLSAARYAAGASSNYVKSSFPIMLGDGENYGALFGGQSYGWFGGGYGPLSTVDRIDFSNDSPTSASLRGPLSAARLEPAAAGNANYGWFGGGQTTSSVNRIDYANDSPSTASPRGPLSIARYGLAATGNANYGWFGGGYGVARYSTVDRIDFSNDSPASASVRGPLAVPRSSVLAAVSNANYAWFGGGNGPSAVTVSTVDRIDFANDSPTSASLRGPLRATRYRHAATGNANYGWFGGGTDPFGNADSTIDRIDFANDSPTAASPRGPLSSIRMRFAATSNANYGWFGGGGSDAGNSRSTVDRIDFANDSPTASSPRGPLSAARRGLSAVSNYVKTSAVRIASSGTVNSGTTAALNINFSIPQYAKTVNPVGTGVGTYGWFGAGKTSFPVVVSRVDRIDFANDSPTTASPRGPLSVERSGLAATGNNNYGWFIGGQFSGGVRGSRVDRIDFSNDSPTSASIRGPLSSNRFNLSAIGNASYGWIAGGVDNNSPSNFYTIVDRIDYANDSPTITSVRGALPSRKYIAAAVGNQNYGWFGGGFTASSPFTTSNIERVDYANDSPTGSSTRGGLNVSRYYHAGSSNANYGWFAGGGTGVTTAISSVDRIDFANDSPTAAAARGPLTVARYSLGGAGNSDYGWFSGGGNISPVVVNTIERIDYSNDSPTLGSLRGPLSAARYEGAATSNYVK